MPDDRVDDSYTALWPLPCESSLQRNHSPGQSLQTAADLQVRYPLLSTTVPRFRRVAAPARPTQALSGPVGLRSVADPLSNLCSIAWFGGDLA
jgi:hypothetical protein